MFDFLCSVVRNFVAMFLNLKHDEMYIMLLYKCSVDFSVNFGSKVTR